MAFSDYLDLRTAVIEHVGRADITDVFPRLTLLAESMLNRKLKLRDQVTSAAVPFVGGVATLPSDFIEAIGLYDENGYEYVQQPLQAVKPARTDGYYAVDGSSLLSSAGDQTLTLEYYARIPTLTTSMATTNWLLDKYPAVYLYAVAFEAAKYLRDLELVQITRSLMNDEISEAMIDDTAARYSRARVRVQGITP